MGGRQGWATRTQEEVTTQPLDFKKVFLQVFITGFGFAVVSVDDNDEEGGSHL